MSAPEVGDRVRVIAGQWVGWEGIVAEVVSPVDLLVMLLVNQEGRAGNWVRPFRRAEVETAPTTRTQPPQRPQDDSGAPVEVPDADGAHRGGKR